MDLPSSKSSDLHLVVATPEELLQQQNDNSEEWKGALSLEAYLRREDYLLQQVLTKDGGLTPWMLVYQPPGSEARQVLCGCETIKKKALVAKGGQVEDVVAHGICSVFCPPRYRGRGYAGRMMTEVGKRLKNWQTENGTQAAFSVLYSDIGKEFYKARGWEPFPSAHIALQAIISSNMELGAVKRLMSDDLAQLCEVDEKLLRSRLAKRKDFSRASVALVPDHRTLLWHHAREDFVSEELRKSKTPLVRGALVETNSGSRVWCIWTRVWTNPQEHAPNTMHILRTVIEDDEFSDFSPATEEGAAKLKDTPIVRALASLLALAREQAQASGMHEVQIWNPTSTTLAAVRSLDPKAEIEHREKESITSLQWYRDGSWQDVDWVCNEKYAWC